MKDLKARRMFVCVNKRSITNWFNSPWFY